MAILMKYGGFAGDSAFDGYEGWCVLSGFSWGFADNNGFGAGGSRPRYAALFKSVSCTAPSGSTGAMALRQALDGKPTEVKLVLSTWSGADGIEPLLLMTLSNAQVTSFTTAVAEGSAIDTFALTYTNVALRFSMKLPGPDGRLAVRNSGNLAYDASDARAG